MPNRAIYLDHAATTPVDERVIAAMLPWLRDQFGNASAAHRYGRRAADALESSRETVARCLGCAPDEIVFTSGGSESDNLALRGAVAGGLRRIVTSAIEHPAVLNTARSLAGEGIPLTVLPVDHSGLLSPQAVAEASGESVLVSLIWGNNEVGTIQPIQAIAEGARARGALVHSDAVQMAGTQRIDLRALPVDLLSLSAHKFGGPQGVGVLFVRAGTPFAARQTGGAQEQYRRAGTENIAGIVGCATALAIAVDELAAAQARLTPLRDALAAGVCAGVPGASLTGHPTERLTHHASFVIEGAEANLMLMHLDMAGIMASSGSACKTGSPEPSEVLLAMGWSHDEALTGLRFTLGKMTTEDEIAYTIEKLPAIVERVRSVSRK